MGSLAHLAVAGVLVDGDFHVDVLAETRDEKCTVLVPKRRLTRIGRKLEIHAHDVDEGKNRRKALGIRSVGLEQDWKRRTTGAEELGEKARLQEGLAAGDRQGVKPRRGEEGL